MFLIELPSPKLSLKRSGEKKAEVCRIRKSSQILEQLKLFLIFSKEKIHFSNLLELFKKVKVDKNGDVFNALGIPQNKNCYSNYFYH